MRKSVKIFRDRVLSTAAVLTLALSLVVALGSNPLAMPRHMENAGPSHGAVTAEMPAMAHETQPAESGGFCGQMAFCTAIISQPPELRPLGTLTERLAPAPMPLTDSRALAPPFHPPIV